MARKRSPAPDPAPIEPSTELVPPPASVSAAPKVADMPVRDLLQMLGRSLPASIPLSARPAPALPAGLDAEAPLTDLTVRDLLQLLAAF